MSEKTTCAYTCSQSLNYQPQRGGTLECPFVHNLSDAMKSKWKTEVALNIQSELLINKPLGIKPDSIHPPPYSAFTVTAAASHKL